MAATPPRRTPPRRTGGGRLTAVLALALLGAVAFLLLVDAVLRQDDPVAPWFTGRMSQTVAASVLAGAMALALVGQVALLLPPPARAQAQGSPGMACRGCGAWIEWPMPDRPCPACGTPWSV